MLFRKVKTIFTGLVLGFMLMGPTFVLAEPGMNYFNQGIKAAKSGDYRAALAQFQKAKNAGLDNLALQYNFGVTYYKLGKFEKAKKAISGLTGTDKYEQLAYYNLGLIANKQKDKAASIAWFQRAFRTGKSDKVKILSREALKRLGATPRSMQKAKKKWTGLLSASFASDSNVTLVNEDLAGTTSQSDTSMILSAYGANWLTGGRDGGARLFLRGYLQNYSSQTTYNYAQFGAGVARYDRLASWYTRVGGLWDETNLGGSSYQRILSAEVRGRKYLSKDSQLRLRYKFSQVDVTDPVYEYLGGTRQQVRMGMRTRMKNSRYRAYYQLELNDRDDFENPAGTTYLFKSYSPTRHTIRVTAWWDISSIWKLRLDGRHRISQYNDDNILASSATENRKDTQTRLSARLSKQLAKNTQLEVKYTVTNNDSSIDSESYDRSLVMLGLTWKY